MIIKKDVMYPIKGVSRKLHIYLPDEYGWTKKRYPVMYFFDGHNLYNNTDATYGKSWGIKDFLDEYDKKMIVVGIECGHDGTERLLEYSPYRPFSRDLADEKVLGDETMQWIINDIKPMIDNEFRTYTHREATGIGGSSMGGLMALYAIIRYNDVFSKGACISSAIGFCMPEIMIDMKVRDISPDTRAFLSWGTREARGVKNHTEIDCSSYTYRNNKAVENKFIERGATPQLYCQLGGGHCEADWEKLVPYFMDFLWKGKSL